MTEPATDAGEWEAVYFDGRVKRGRLVTLRFGPALEIAESGVFLTAPLQSGDLGKCARRRMTA